MESDFDAAYDRLMDELQRALDEDPNSDRVKTLRKLIEVMFRREIEAANASVDPETRH